MAATRTKREEAEAEAKADEARLVGVDFLIDFVRNEDRGRESGS